MQKLIIATVLCAFFVSSIKAQGLAEMMMMSSMFGNRGNSGSSSSTGLSSLMPSLSSSGSGSSSTGSSSSGLSALAGRGGGMGSLMSNMGRMGPAMMMGGAEMSNMMEFYTCGLSRIPPQMCWMMMQQNM